MTSDRKKPGVAFWATVVAVVVVLAYPLSIAPAWWICYKAGSPDWMLEFTNRLYEPLWTVALLSDKSSQWLLWYSQCLLPSDDFFFID
jgi:hypothetical protein